ncbi:MAG: glycoside hydrolase family 30 beta sandwich domain-containing protein [Microcoleus sp.]
MGALSGLSGLGALSGLMPGVPPMQIHNVVTIDWSGNALPINQRISSVNLYQALNPTIAQSQDYRDAIDYLNPAMVRIHSLEMMNDSTSRPLGWVKNPTLSTYEWDTQKITAALSGLAPGRAKMLAICRFPRAIADAQGRLLAGKSSEFAAFCVQLLTIADQAGANITHINLLNELDSAYNNNFALLGAIWNEARDAIKSAFPSMLVGGHSFANVYGTANVDAYLTTCALKLDYFCFNAYSTGNPGGTTQQQIWNSAVNTMKDACTHAKNKLTAKGRSDCPVYMTERGMLFLSAYNPLNVGSARLVWEALCLMKTANSNASFAALWNEADDWHGAHSSPSSGYQKRPTAHLYHMWNQLIAGAMLPIAITGETVPVVNSTPVQGVQAIAAQKPNGKKAIAIVNRSELPRNIRIQHNGWVPNPSVILDVNLITESGIQTAQIPYEDFVSGYSMPLNSVAMISIQ